MNPAPASNPELVALVLDRARQVLTALQPGLSAKAYENALAIALQRRGRTLERDRVFDVYYEGELVDVFVAPLVVDDQLLVEVDVAPATPASDGTRLECGLAVAGLPLGLRLEFGAALAWRQVRGRPVFAGVGEPG